MVQGGDPSGTGTGGPGYSFEIEPPQRPYVRGGLAMANKGTPNSNGSQFFIILDDLTEQGRLSPDFTLFGQIKEGPPGIVQHAGQNRGGAGRYGCGR